MVLKVKKWYKILNLLVLSSSTPFVLYLFSLPLSDFVTFVIILAYFILVIMFAESLIFKIEIKGSKLKSMYFSIDLSDIIGVKNGILETVIRTRWRIYRIPPVDGVNKIGRMTNMLVVERKE